MLPGAKNKLILNNMSKKGNRYKSILVDLHSLLNIIPILFLVIYVFIV